MIDEAGEYLLLSSFREYPPDNQSLLLSPLVIVSVLGLCEMVCMERILPLPKPV